MPAESIEVPASADNGNVPADAPVAPSPAPQEPVAPAAPVAPATPAEPVLYDLPDGRKVDAETLTKEWKQNFLPEFTKKSQELANLTKKDTPDPKITTPADPLANPDYVPQSYAEIVNLAKEQTIREIEARNKAVIDQQTAIETAVNEQLTAVKTIDKTVDENKLFQHATKWGFKDLRLAHQNMTEMAKIAKDAQQIAAKNVLKRNDPVSVIPGASGGTKPDPSAFATARDFLRSLQS